MKIEMTKHGMTRFCQPNQLEQMASAGWKQKVSITAGVVKTVDEPLALKPPVKSRGTVKTQDNAIQQGDE
jgi:hypothetical protein